MGTEEASSWRGRWPWLCRPGSSAFQLLVLLCLKPWFLQKTRPRAPSEITCQATTRLEVEAAAGWPLLCPRPGELLFRLVNKYFIALLIFKVFYVHSLLTLSTAL